ncbi:hypothetical protein SCP_1101820 [Sparassis crispa]|uniref:Uncharacterized protein n=1 Tax=Sparassis crispa TaxID=139825 RepID=A0A401GZB1_9APHY|nr:hypothetical protein SCP_1101820 [Sparassis crispa]GBE87505.1 hypothetical protein SCP_1101820 [Sparassis crispa]
MVVETPDLPTTERTDRERTFADVAETPRNGSTLPFPVELLRMIFSHILHGSRIEESPKRTLEDLTLTCKVFYHLAQPFLFDSCTLSISCTWQRVPPEGTVYPSYADSFLWDIRPLSTQEAEKTLRKLDFIGQERIASGVHRCLLAPLAYPRHWTELIDRRQEDTHERIIVDRFFYDLVPKLANLKALELIHVTLGLRHLCLLQDVCTHLHSLTSETCFLLEDEAGEEMPLEDHSRMCIILPFEHLVYKEKPVYPGIRKTYLPLPDPSHVKSLSCHLYSYELSSDRRSREQDLLFQLTALAKFTSLRSLDITIWPYGTTYDWRQFIFSHCGSIENLSIQKRTDANLDPVAPRGLPPLKLFRGMWDDISLYALQQGGLRHLVVTGKRAEAPGDRLWDRPSLRDSEVLIALNNWTEGFASLESLELKIGGTSGEDIIVPLLGCCPRLRALKLMGERTIPNAVLLLSSAFVAVASSPNMEYFSLPRYSIMSGDRTLLNLMISALSVPLRTQCPNLRYVHYELLEISLVLEGSVEIPDARSCNVQFDPSDGRILPDERRIEDWRNSV